MKKIMLMLITVAFLLTGTASKVTAQKIAYINSDELVMAMPERDSALAKLESKRQEYAKMDEELRVEYNKKMETYVQKRDSLSALVLQTKEAELADLENKIRTFQSAADQDLQTQQRTLFQPIFDKAQTAIKSVAVDLGLTYVLDISSGAVIYYPEDDTSLNILPQVKAKLGLTK